MSQRRSFSYVASSDARVLILGSLPGEESLRLQQYYAKKENAFWRIMGALTGAGPELPYPQRLTSLKKSGVALWDVCASAFRPGSLDAKIELSSVETNDFASFYKTHKKIELVCFNGRYSEMLYDRKILPLLPSSLAALPRERLPSTSPAHAGMRYEEKLLRWREALQKAVKRSD